MKGFPKPYRRGDNIKQAKPFPPPFFFIIIIISRKLDYYLIGKFTGTGPNFYFILIQIRSKGEEEGGAVLLILVVCLGGFGIFVAKAARVS